MKKFILLLLISTVLTQFSCKNTFLDDIITKKPQISYNHTNFIKVIKCKPELMSKGSFIISAYDDQIFTLNNNGEIIDVLNVFGPINTWVPEKKGGGYGIIHGQPTIINQKNKIIYNSNFKIKDKKRLQSQFPGFCHHEIIKTKWNTFLVLVAKKHPTNIMEDFICEFNLKGDLLKKLSLNKLVFNNPIGSVEVGEWKENWLHTNSLDTRTNHIIMVSLRNLDTVIEIDWKTDKIINRFGNNILSHQHYVKYQKNKTILAFNNGVKEKQSSIVRFDKSGKILQEYKLPFFAPAYGSVQETPNGNYIVINGEKGMIYEFSPDCKEIYAQFQYKKQDYIPFHKKYNSILYRVYKL